MVCQTHADFCKAQQISHFVIFEECILNKNILQLVFMGKKTFTRPEALREGC